MAPIDIARIPPRAARIEFAAAGLLTLLLILEIVHHPWATAVILVLLGVGVATTVVDDVRNARERAWRRPLR